MDVDEQKATNIDELLDKVAELLNEASLSSKESVKLSNLKHVQEIILHKCPTLLDNFLEEILPFQCDKSIEVKKYVIAFLEEACKKDSEIIFKVIDNFRYLLFDENVNVQKRSYLAMIIIFKNTLKWLVKHKVSLDEIQQQTWQSLIDIKSHIVSQLDSDNDGIRTSAIKFLEMLIIVLSVKTKDSIIPAINQHDVSVDQIPNDHLLLDRNFLIEEGHHNMRKLLEYTLSTHISSVNLITSICVLSNIAKQRPEYMAIVLNTYSKLLQNMPPTLGNSQVSTVRKQIKLQIISICKNPSCGEHVNDITKILTDLGTSSNEISKILPKTNSNESRKRQLSSFSLESNDTKKSKTNISSLTSKLPNEATIQQSKSVDSVNLEKIIDDIVVKLSVKENVTDLVMVSMAYLPEQMPKTFINSFKPISAAGTNLQIRSLARMLALQLNEAKLISVDSSTKNSVVTIDEDIYDEDNDENEDIDKPIISLPTEKKDPFELNELNESSSSKKSKPQQISTKTLPIKPLNSILPSKKASNKAYKLNDVTLIAANQFNTQSLEELLFKTYSRILSCEETINKCKEASIVRKRVIVESASLHTYENQLTNYIFEDVRKRIDLGLMWIYNNYLKLKEAYRIKKLIHNIKDEPLSNKIINCDDVFELKYGSLNENELLNQEKENLKDIQNYELEYDRTLYTILFSLQQRQDSKDFLFSKIICQVPLLTENSVKLLKSFCQDESRFYFSLNTLFDLIRSRISQRSLLINLLLELTHEKNEAIRAHAITLSLKLYHLNEFRDLIEKYSIDRLKNLIHQNPPLSLFADSNDDQVKELETIQWNEESIKSCLYLFLDLLPANHQLIHSLSHIYVSSIAEVKRVILKLLEVPIKSMSMESNELLKFLEEFPSGSETLVLRTIHILTENTSPSLELVNRVRGLFQKRLPDVRFLIPVLTGLSKHEIISALPQLIKLSQAVVKEVFNRLLGINGAHKSPITPAELLIALHQIDQSVCDLKTVINATSLCFSEKQIYTQEILATVLQQLIDVTPIPTLYMRTVIQSVTMYPKLTGFVIIMMQRLISKQVWKYSKVWEGFIKCCQRIKSISHQVLLQLPPVQLKEVLTTAPDLREHVSKHVSTLNPQQKSQIPDQLLQIIEQNN